MTLEEVLATLGDNDAAKEQVVELVNAEKQKGINKYSQKDREVLELKGLIKDLGYDKEKYATKDEFVAEKRDLGESVTKSKGTIASLQEQMDELRNDLAAKDEAIKKEKTASKNNAMLATLAEKVGDDFVGGGKYLIKDLVREGAVDMVDGEVVFVKGDKVVDFNTGVAELKEANKGMLKVTQKGGTGGTSGDSSGSQETELSVADQIAQKLNKKG